MFGGSRSRLCNLGTVPDPSDCRQSPQMSQFVSEVPDDGIYSREPGWEVQGSQYLPHSLLATDLTQSPLIWSHSPTWRIQSSDPEVSPEQISARHRQVK